MPLDKNEKTWYNDYIDREQELIDQSNKIRDELNAIRQERLIKNREPFVGKYFHTYIDDGHNRHQYIYVKEIIDGNLHGWWFTTGDTFTHEYTISTDPEEILNHVADNSFYNPHKTWKYQEISEEDFLDKFELIFKCVDDKRFYFLMDKRNEERKSL